jgi:hypothetical protein
LSEGKSSDCRENRAGFKKNESDSNPVFQWCTIYIIIDILHRNFYIFDDVY